MRERENAAWTWLGVSQALALNSLREFLTWLLSPKTSTLWVYRQWYTMNTILVILPVRCPRDLKNQKSNEKKSMTWLRLLDLIQGVYESYCINYLGITTVFMQLHIFRGSQVTWQLTDKSHDHVWPIPLLFHDKLIR